MDCMDVIRTRRSIRQYRPDAIPDDILSQILEAGRLAPSTMHWQPWYFGVVRDPELKQELTLAAGNQEWIVTAPIVMAMCVPLVRDLKTLPEDDPWIACNNLRFGSDLVDHLNAFSDRRAMMKYADTADIFIAGQQMVLAAESFGISSCWIGYLNIDRASRLLKLPDDIACLYLLPMGYPAVDPDPIERKSIDEVVFYDTWS